MTLKIIFGNVENYLPRGKALTTNSKTRTITSDLTNSYLFAKGVCTVKN
jgi:hypothetical protein